MSEKKPYSDRRWTDIPKCIVIGHSEVTEEEKKIADDFIKNRMKIFNRNKTMMKSLMMRNNLCQKTTSK